jgi:hypothetical protein
MILLAYESLPLSPRLLDRDSLDDVSCDLLIAAVAKLGRPGIGVAGQPLNIIKQDTLEKKVGYRRHTERLRRESGRQPRSFHSPLDHAAHVNGGHGVRG